MEGKIDRFPQARTFSIVARDPNLALLAAGLLNADEKTMERILSVR